MAPPRVHDDNPDPAGRGDRKALRRAPATGDVVGQRSRPGPFDHDDDGPSAEDIERFGDVTRRCPECGKDVYDEATQCYHCGHMFMGTAEGAPGRNRLWVVLTVVVIVGAFLFALLGNLF